MATDAKKITYDGKPVQVESAVRDSTGKIINQTYQEKPEVIEYTVPSTVSNSYKVIATYDGTYDGSAGYVKFRMEVKSTSMDQVFEAEMSWGGIYGDIAILTSNHANPGANDIRLRMPSTTAYYSTMPPEIWWDARGSGEERTVKVTILASSGNLIWKTDWNTSTSVTSTFWGVAGQLLGSFARYSDSAITALQDGSGKEIRTFYTVHAEYTISVSTSQEYHKPFSELALGTNGSYDARIPRLVEIYDASGNQIQTDVTIDLTNSRITIYPTAVNPAQTWTVRVTAW